MEKIKFHRKFRPSRTSIYAKFPRKWCWFTIRAIYQKFVVFSSRRYVTRFCRTQTKMLGLECTSGILITRLRELAVPTWVINIAARRLKSLSGISRSAWGPLIMQQPAGDEASRMRRIGGLLWLADCISLRTAKEENRERKWERWRNIYFSLWNHRARWYFYYS